MRELQIDKSKYAFPLGKKFDFNSLGIKNEIFNSLGLKTNFLNFTNKKQFFSKV